MEQVIENLVENAIKYGPDEEAPSIEIGEVDGQARIAVVDRGVGIPDAERERIFERFFRASNVQSVTDTGLGLGLYICRRIIDEHGGRIWHEPTPGGGSTFVITLPLETDRPAADVADDDERTWQRPVSAEAAADA
jgi:signal transduction histidine kinase